MRSIKNTTRAIIAATPGYKAWWVEVDGGEMFDYYDTIIAWIIEHTEYDDGYYYTHVTPVTTFECAGTTGSVACYIERPDGHFDCEGDFCPTREAAQAKAFRIYGKAKSGDDE